MASFVIICELSVKAHDNVDVDVLEHCFVRVWFNWRIALEILRNQDIQTNRFDLLSVQIYGESFLYDESKKARYIITSRQEKRDLC